MERQEERFRAAARTRTRHSRYELEAEDFAYMTSGRMRKHRASLEGRIHGQTTCRAHYATTRKPRDAFIGRWSFGDELPIYI